MKGKVTGLSLLVVMVFFQGLAWGAPAEPVSPGDTSGFSVTPQNCPTFSWSAADSAVAYRLEVYEKMTTDLLSREQMMLTGTPATRKEIAAPALSWTPSGGECLTRGRQYVWYVQGTDAQGHGQWSGGSVVGVEAAVLTAEQQDAVKNVVKDYIESDKASQGAAVTEQSSVGQTAGSVVPMSLIEGSFNTALGSGAGFTMIDGGFFNTGTEYVTFLGATAGQHNTTTGSDNTFVGATAGQFNETGDNNSFVGSRTGWLNVGGSKNSFVGSRAGYNNNGSFNTFVGYVAGEANTAAINNTFVGQAAGWKNSDGHDNTFIGNGAGLHNISADYNTFVGSLAGAASQADPLSGDYNSFLGYAAGNSNTTGSQNSFFGYETGRFNDTGFRNSYFGYEAGWSNKWGIGNSFFGYEAGELNSEGSANVFIGYQAGYSETGSNKLYIDNCYTLETPPDSGNWCTQPLIYGEFVTRVVRIDGSLTMVSVATPSDIRYKKEIHPLEMSLQKVLQLQGVTYEWDKDKVNGAGFKKGRQIGLIAQEVEQVLPELVYTDKDGYKTLSYDKLAPVLIEAVKEQQKEIREKDARIEKLEKALEMIERRLASLENAAEKVALK